MMKNRNILLVDVGNTSTCVAYHNGSELSLVSRVDTFVCNKTAVRRVMTEILKGKVLSDGVLCSVVPGVNKIWINEIKRNTGKSPIVVTHKLDLGVSMDYPKPQTIGSDRLANASAVVEKYGFPVIVADFGTATTFDVVNAKCAFIGGVIAPGFRMMTDYMAEKTALLPRIKIEGRLSRIGRSTAQAMRIGALAGYRGLVREITQYIIRQNNLGRIKFVATGGLAEIVLRGSGLYYQVDKTLTLRGLYRIFKLNNKQ